MIAKISFSILIGVMVANFMCLATAAIVNRFLITEMINLANSNPLCIVEIDHTFKLWLLVCLILTYAVTFSLGFLITFNIETERQHETQD